MQHFQAHPSLLERLGEAWRSAWWNDWRFFSGFWIGALSSAGVITGLIATEIFFDITH